MFRIETVSVWVVIDKLFILAYNIKLPYKIVHNTKKIKQLLNYVINVDQFDILEIQWTLRNGI